MKQQLDLFVPAKAPSPRLKRVEHEVRQILAEIFQKQDIAPVWNEERELIPFPGPLTVTSVKISPDLHECWIGVTPLDPNKAAATERYLPAAEPLIRKSFAKRSVFRVVPRLFFHLDTTFAKAERLDALLKARSPREENA